MSDQQKVDFFVKISADSRSLTAHYFCGVPRPEKQGGIVPPNRFRRVSGNPEELVSLTESWPSPTSFRTGQSHEPLGPVRAMGFLVSN
jgi:hypothetical protein